MSLCRDLLLKIFFEDAIMNIFKSAGWQNRISAHLPASLCSTICTMLVVAAQVEGFAITPCTTRASSTGIMLVK